MLIDWFTVGAQIVNFFALVWLLKRYLFGPIVKVIDAREKDIATRRQAATADQVKAHAEREDCLHEREKLEGSRNAILADSKADALKERAKLLDEAAHAADDLRQIRLKDLSRETADFQADLIRLTKEEIVAGSRKMVRDLATADLSSALLGVFTSRLASTPGLSVSNHSDVSQEPIRLNSSFPLSPTQQQELEIKIQQSFHTDKKVEFHNDPNILFGVNLTVGDQKISWNVDEYLSSFSDDVSALAQKKLGAGASR